MATFSGEPHSSLLIYGNVLINDQFKFETFMYTLPQWVDYWKSPCYIRVRGVYSRAVADFCSNLQNVECVQGATYRQWRMQTRWDLEKKNFRFVMLYLEDHMLNKSPPDGSRLLNELLSYDVQVFQYSWNRQYRKISQALQKLQENKNMLGVYASLDDQELRKVLEVDYRWLISLTSIFERNFLLRLLKSSRPYIKKFDPKAPYTIEQKPESSWFLPIVFGLSKAELGICIDDDNTIHGSSAISRGLYHGARPSRGEYHHAKISLIQFVWKAKEKIYGTSSIPFVPLALKLFVTKFITWPTYISYSIQSLILRFMDWIVSRKIEER